MTGVHRRSGPTPGRTRTGTADPGRVLRRRRGPRQLALGCQDGQGYMFARPLSTTAMTELLAKSLADGGFYLATAHPVEAAAAT